MAQSGYTPIQLYYSTTAAAVPVNTNLASGELALNIQDEKLYFKNAAGTVKLLASNATSAPVTSFQTSLSGLTPSTATTGAVTLAGTLGTANGGTGLTSFTSGGVVYASSSSALATGSGLVFDGTNLGIGNTSPTSYNGAADNLVIGTSGNNGMTIVSGSTSSGYIMFADGTTGQQQYEGQITYDHTNNFMALSTNGTEKLRLDSAGNLGLGVTPSSFTASNLKAFQVKTASVSSNGGSSYFSSNVNKTSGGNLYIDTGAYASAIEMNNAGGGGMQFMIAPFGTAGNAISFTQAMTLNASGNLGIGTTSPSRQLELSTILAGAPTGTGFVGGALRLSNLTEYESNYDTGGGNPDFLGSIEFYSGDTSTGTGVRTAIKTSVDTYFNTNSLCFYTAPSSTAGILERMRISAAGNLGIGTSSPTDTFSFTKALDVNGSSGAYVYVRNNGSATNVGGIGYSGSDLYISNQAAGNIRFLCNTSASERARISSTGGFSVGTTADPGAGAIYATGNITAYYSDARLKTVSGKIENALDKVAQLSGVYYTNNSVAKSFGYDSDEVQVGVLAQEVGAVLPQIVKAAPFDLDEHGNSKSGENYKTVQYERLVPLLIEAINELQAKVKALESK